MKNLFANHLILILFVAAGLAGAIFAGCAKKSAKAGIPAPLPAGAVDSFDAWAFQQLSELKAGIDQAKSEYAAGNLPSPQGAKVIDQAANAFNLAEGLAQRYHDSGGKAADAASLQSEITLGISQVASYIASLRGTAAATKSKPGSAPAPPAK